MQATDTTPKDKGTKTASPADLTGDDDVFDSALNELAAEGLLDDEPVVTPVDDTPVADPVEEPAFAETIDAPVVVEAAAPVAEAPAVAVDPLADTSPLDYGQGKAFDGVLVDKTNGGAFILPEKLDSIRQTLAERDTFREQATQLSQRVQHFDGLSYKSTGYDGPSQEFKGVEAFVRAQADAAAAAAGTLEMMKQIETLFPGEANAKGRVELYDKVQFAMQKTGFDVGQKVRGYVSTNQQQITDQSGLPSDAQWFATALTQIQKVFPALTPADMEAGRQFFAKRPQMVYRNATAHDAAKFGVKIGARVADPDAMNEWYSERASLRADEAKLSAARATAAGTAGKHNAGMEKGRQTGKKPVSARRPQAATPANAIPEKVSKHQVYTDILDEALQEMGLSD